MYGPTLEASQLMHAGKYRGPGEPFKECMNRVASTLTDNSAQFHLFRDILLTMRYMPAGRIQQAMGSTRDTCAHNCFVSGTIEDSFVDGQGSIMARATQAAQTMRKGGGIGYDFSPLRPRGSLIAKLGSQSSGPCSFMPIYNAIGQATASAGHRRGAEMGVLRIDHPDIEEFVRMKQKPGVLEAFNISVAVSDEFMRSLAVGVPFPLRFEKRTFREIDPKALWEMIMRSTWDWAEPGVLFIDTVNSWNNLYYCETIAATNPCGEQPLPPFGACLLGSFNLVKYLYEEAGRWVFNFDLFRKDIPTVVEAMDNVVDRARYPLYEQEKEAKSKRRMGLGVTGVANTIEAMGHPYGSPGFVEKLDEILSILKEEAYRASAELARRKGPFPLFDREKYLAGKFISRLDPMTRDLIAVNGIRNSHLLSIAPTGTISFCADNVSSSIECVIGYEVDREVQTFDGPVLIRKIPDYGVRELDVRGLLAKDVPASGHLDVLACASRHVDSAVSKTCNVPSTMPWDEFKDLYIRAYELGCKGITTYQMGGKRGSVIKESEPEVACRISGSCEA